jgi:hypothetical protein
VLKSQLHDQPFNVVTFEKSNGIENDVFGQKIYLLQFKATVVFPSGLNHRCKPRANGELRGLDALQDSLRFLQECSDQRYYYQRYYEAGAKQDFSDSYEFDKTERGWSGPDGKVY